MFSGYVNANGVSVYTYDSYGNILTTTIGNESTFIKSQNIYTSNGNYLTSQINPSGNSVTYNYDQTKGTLTSFTDAKSATTSYTYDPYFDRLTGVSKTVSGQQVSNSYGYQYDRLSSITHNGFSYSFAYDLLGNLTQVLAGTQPLITNTYEARTSRLMGSTYGNGQSIGYEYDNFDRIIAKKYNNVTRYKYAYDGSGNVGVIEDIVNNVSYRYLYDMAERISKVVDSIGNSTEYEYNRENDIHRITEKKGSGTYSINYSYDKDRRPVKITGPNGSFTSYTYDILNRITGSTINTGFVQYNTTYSYLSGASGSSTYRLGTINNNGSAISYTYDANGNIETITQSGNQIKYYYDELNKRLY